jgi:hypothetical protein
MWNVEEIRCRGAYHEAAHAVVDVVLGSTVRYVSIETEGTDYRYTCVTAVTNMESELACVLMFRTEETHAG